MKRILQISMCVLMLAALAVGSGACSGSAADEGDGDSAERNEDGERQARRNGEDGKRASGKHKDGTDKRSAAFWHSKPPWKRTGAPRRAAGDGAVRII